MEVYSVKFSGIETSGIAAPQIPAKQGSRTKPVQASAQITIQPERKKDNEAISTSFPKMLEIAKQVGEKLKSSGVSIQFEVNKDAGQIVIKVLDPVSGKVVRKIPPEAYMKSVEYLSAMQNKLLLQGIEVDVHY